MGMIGCGWQGGSNLNAFLNNPAVAFFAVLKLLVEAGLLKPDDDMLGDADHQAEIGVGEAFAIPAFDIQPTDDCPLIDKWHGNL